MPEESRDILHQGLVQLDLTAYEQAIWHSFQLLKRWNRAYNLVADAVDRTLITRHLLDSLSIRPLITGTDCLDVGTGAGLPGLLLAVTMPGTEWVLLDANGKKIRFCEQAIHELGLNNARAMQQRIEAYQPGMQFDTIISRAYDQAGSFIQQTRHLLKQGGRLLAMKGRIDKEEKDNAAALGLDMQIAALSVPMLTGERHAMIFTQ